MKFNDQFKKYCEEIASKNKIQIVDKNEWFVSIKNKGWNQYQKIHNLYKKYHKNKKLVPSNYLINLYKININVRNILYKYSLFIEEYIKSLLHYHKYDTDDKINELSIGKLIKKIKQLNLEEEILQEINGKKFKLQTKATNYYESWKKLRNLSCHRGFEVILSSKDLKSNVKNMMFLINNNVKYSNKLIYAKDNFIKQFNKSLQPEKSIHDIKIIINNLVI